MILLDIGSREGGARAETSRPRTGVYFRSEWAETIRDAFGDLIPASRRHGLSVFAMVSLRRMNWVDPTLGWMDRSYDPARRQILLSPYLDLFHPAFQEYLVGLLKDLASTGIDGVLFRNDAPMGPKDGFTSYAVQGFERDFKIRVDPSKLFAHPTQGDAPSSREARNPDRSRQTYPPEFWRWIGWKAREQVKIMDRLRRATQMQAPTLQFALEIHPEAVTDPVTALIQYGEDLLEAKRTFNFFLTKSTLSRSSLQAGTVQDSGGTAAFIDRMKELVGEATRIWIEMPIPGNKGERPMDRVRPAVDREGLEPGIGLIYMGN